MSAEPAGGAPMRRAIRLLCLPSAGASSVAFRSWSAEMPDGVEVHAVDLPGRQLRLEAPLLDTVPELSGWLARELRAKGPFALFGHSMGALLAFELARELRRLDGTEPVYLFVSGCPAPHIRPPSRGWSRLPDPMLLGQVRRGTLIPPELTSHDGYMALMLPILRADLAACEAYRYEEGPPLGCPISAYGGASDPDVSWSALSAWRRHTAAATSCRLFPGDHHYLRRPSNRLAAVVGRALASTLEARAGGRRTIG